jgi:hypothetical protein
LIVEPFKAWWCCLNPRERNALQYLVVAYASNPSYIEQSAYSIIAFITGLASLTEVNEFFITHYSLVSGIILDPEGNPISVYYFDGEFWPALLVFSLTGEFFCAAPCKVLVFNQ